jgi:IS5 family transposase
MLLLLLHFILQFPLYGHLKREREDVNCFCHLEDERRMKMVAKLITAHDWLRDGDRR